MLERLGHCLLCPTYFHPEDNEYNLRNRTGKKMLISEIGPENISDQNSEIQYSFPVLILSKILFQSLVPSNISGLCQILNSLKPRRESLSFNEDSNFSVNHIRIFVVPLAIFVAVTFAMLGGIIF